MVHGRGPFQISMFAKDQCPFMLFFSGFHVWHAWKRADRSHGDEFPIGRIEVLTHAAVKKGVEGRSLGLLQRGC